MAGSCFVHATGGRCWATLVSNDHSRPGLYAFVISRVSLLYKTIGGSRFFCLLLSLGRGGYKSRLLELAAFKKNKVYPPFFSLEDSDAKTPGRT